MTEQFSSQYEQAQALLREAKPEWLKQMMPDSPIALPEIPERQSKFNMGITPVALIGDTGGGGGIPTGGNMTVAAAKLVSTGVFTVVLISINATEVEE